jgi:septal ring factor EnvC (AmiA/AmiB activator)
VSVFLALTSLIPPVSPVPPVHGPITTQYSPPACRFCSGHRGVVVATTAGSQVRAAVPGHVQFAGPVAGRLYVVETVDGAAGVTITYGWMAVLGQSLASGIPLAAAQPLGAAGPSTYLGVKVGGLPADPLPWLGVRRPRLTDRVSEAFGDPRVPRTTK